ncbi:PAS domain S-box protein, partial [Oxalobacteraceae bacterium OM1]
FERFHGMAAEAALGRTAAELLPPPQLARDEASDHAVLARGEPVYAEEAALQANDGTLHHFVFAKVPLRDNDGRVQGLCGILSDVTPLKQAESEVRELNQSLERRVAERTEELAEVNAELRDANTQLEAFSYTVAHDLRAPLRGIQGFADAVAEDYAERLDAVGRDYLMRIGRAAARMEGLIDDLLAFARLARVDLPLTRVPLDDVVAEALRLLADAIGAARARIDVGQSLHAVRANPAACVQIVQNLLSNAIKFSRPGVPPHVRVRSERRGACVRLWVEDNGIGIPPEQRARIFRPFERLHGQEEYAGTGIGLAIVDKAARRMGGACGMDGRAEGGSCFWIELRAADAMEGESP